jgi:hypothetical protein
MQQIAQCLLQTSITAEALAPAAPDLACPCGGVRAYDSRPHGRRVQTRVGGITVPPRARYRCATCQHRSYPCDEMLALPPRQQMSQCLRDQCAYLATLLPYAQASQVLAYLVGGTVCPRQIWHAVQQLGAQKETAQHQEYTDLQARPEPVPAQTTHQSVGADGVMDGSRERTEEGTYPWHALKTAAVYDAPPAPVPPPHRAVAILRHQGDASVPRIDQAQTITYAASARSWDDLGQQTQVELQRRGPQRERIALGDGAGSVQAFFDTYVRAPGVHLTRILDVRHAEQPLWGVATLLPERQHQMGLREAVLLLEQGQASALCHLLDHTATTAAPDGPLTIQAQRAAAYFTRHAAHIDYLDFMDHH